MLVNLGVLFFVALDYVNHCVTIKKNIIFTILFSTVLVILLDGQIGIVLENNNNYIDFVKSKWLTYSIFGVYLSTIYRVKLATNDSSFLDFEEPNILEEL